MVNFNYVPLLPLALLSFLANTGREIYKGIEDVLGDKQAGIQTLPLKYGIIRSRLIASTFILFAIALSFLPYFLNIFGHVYLFFVAIADTIFLAAVVVPAKFSSKLCKIAMLVSLAAFFFGSIA
jgi:geranylgeranylglycerol-phosphate geranylgeranyltransferase